MGEVRPTMRWCWALVCLAGLASGVAEDAMLNQCSELKAQEHLDLNEVRSARWISLCVCLCEAECLEGLPMYLGFSGVGRWCF